MSNDMGWDAMHLPPVDPQPPKRASRFADATDVMNLMLRVVGASACLMNATGFDTDEGVRIANDAVERLIELGWP